MRKSPRISLASLSAGAALLLLCLAPAVRAAGQPSALAEMQKRLPSAFSKARLSAQDQLIVEAPEVFLSTAVARQKEAMAAACAAWGEAQSAAGIEKASPYVTVVTSGGGALWVCEKVPDGKSLAPRVVEGWSDESLAFSQSGRDRWFGFLGGQYITGGDVNVTGLTARVGSTLRQNRYDLAGTLNYVSFDTTPGYKVTSFGLVGRELFPLSRHAGWNAGAQILRTQPSIGDGKTTLSLLGGINLYLPGGSLDVTLVLGGNNTSSLLLGYTFYLTQQPVE